MTETLKTQLAILGGGPGGYAAAFHAADLGLDVTLIDREANPGGVCLYRGCIPSKALLHVSRLLHEARQAREWGISFGEPKIDLTALRAWKDSVVKKLTGGLGQLARGRKIRYLRGDGCFKGAGAIEVALEGGQRARVEPEHTIVATGSQPTMIPGWPTQSRRLLDSTRALELERVPASLLVVGGGYIGLELGTVYAALGSKVTVVEMTPGILPGCDRDLARVLEKRIKAITEELLVDTKVSEMREGASGLLVRFTLPDGKSQERTYDQVLVAVGRRPTSQGFGLETTGARVDRYGFIEVNAERRTTSPRIFAIGDVAGQPMLAHKASAEARVAVECIHGKKRAFEPQAIPAVVFTDPEIAWCGLTETDAERAGRAVKIARFPWQASGRALAMGLADGLTKLVIDPESERILGVGIAGTGAGELIAEGVLAIEMGATALDLELTIHAHPTLSETLMEAAGAFYGRATHVMGKKS